MTTKGWLARLALVVVACQGNGPCATDGNPMRDGSPPRSPGPVTFRLTFLSGPGGAATLYASNNYRCTGVFVSVTDSKGAAVDLFGCSTGNFTCPRACPVSACDAPPVAIPRGGHSDVAWDGMTYTLDSELGCYKGPFPAASGTYTAKYCYSFQASGSPVTCDEKAFALPVADRVLEDVVAMR
jgi:hypothetical protein